MVGLDWVLKIFYAKRGKVLVTKAGCYDFL